MGEIRINSKEQFIKMKEGDLLIFKLYKQIARRKICRFENGFPIVKINGEERLIRPNDFIRFKRRNYENTLER